MAQCVEVSFVVAAGDNLRSRHTRPRAVARPMASPASASGSVTGRVVGRRRCSKRLAFYDLRELVACDVDAGALPSLLVHRRAPSSPSSALPAAADASSSPHPVFAPTDSVELVAKSGAAGGFADEAALAAAQREALKLGNVVRVRGAWSVEGEDEVRVLVDRVELVERWADANPGTHFTRSAPPSSSGRKPGTAAGEPTTAAKNDPPLGPCKFWVNQGACHKGDACRYLHGGGGGDDATGARSRGARQKSWVADRARRRRELAALDGDPHGLDGVATKQHRAKKFAEWLVATFGEEALKRGRGALDVAGGRGDVAFELHTVRGVPTTLVEPRARKLNRAQHKWMKRRARGAVGAGEAGGPAEAKTTETFDDSAAETFQGVLCEHVRETFTPATWSAYADCSAVVGMHPDQATEAIADFAIAHRKPFAIVPCCVFPQLHPERVDPGEEEGEGEEEGGSSEEARTRRKTNAVPGAPVTERRQLVRWLARKTGGKVAFLDFQGANQVVYRTTFEDE